MTFVYETPRLVRDPAECFFYHRMELPEFGVVGGDWDLRACLHDYLGRVDFKGRRVLDLGAASGFNSFSMERLGATVVSHDIADGANWNVVPHYKLRDKLPKIRSDMSLTLERLKSGYWLAHRSLESKAKVFYGDIYNLPKDLGEFDILLYGMILTHLRDPFQALYSGARLCRDTIIVTGIFSQTERPLSTFRPAAEKTGNLDIKSWWLLSTGTIKGMLGALGFGIERIVEFDALVLATGQEGPRKCQAIVASRTAASRLP